MKMRGTGSFFRRWCADTDLDKQGAQRDPRSFNESTGKADHQGVIVDGRRRGVPGFGNGRPGPACCMWSGVDLLANAEV